MVKFFLAVVLTAFLATNVNGVNYTVQVGVDDTLAFSPDRFDANVGDSVVFYWVSQKAKHSVIEADREATCMKSNKPLAFKSETYTGYMEAPPKAVWQLDTVGPLYYYCDVGTHCSEASMYGVIKVLEVGETPQVPGYTKLPAPKPTTTAGAKTGKKTKAAAADEPSSANVDKQVSFAVMCSALIPLAVNLI
ncbi:20246_t:CDS:2 [Funneliformis geosporum]|uniref:1202_t:CDS:1 n=1 Tax=Funneliformis geosporum TaxID=1117311 RepID=A0A9W4SII7_9GLOM|nr:1202_t:CDS:2 [Funneliformis geosporum]CAI2183482.1 20246_t:CDS:2 [Funneliformis geosporum]